MSNQVRNPAVQCGIFSHYGLMKLLVFLILMMLSASPAIGEDKVQSGDSLKVDLTTDPDCTYAGSWAQSMAFVHLKNAGLTDNYKLDSTKTKIVKLASEKIGGDLYRQVHLVTFTEKSGKKIEVITINDASHQECSESGVDVFVISRHLGGQ